MNCLLLFILVILLAININSEGTYLRNPPYWYDKTKLNKFYDRNNSIDCLQNRTIYTIGISTARQYIFSILDLINPFKKSITRKEQKLLCPSSNNLNKNFNYCIQKYQNITFKYLFLHYFEGFDYAERGGFPYIFNKKLYKDNLTNPNSYWYEYGKENYDILLFALIKFYIIINRFKRRFFPL
jgi:hypothetical protein